MYNLIITVKHALRNECSLFFARSYGRILERVAVKENLKGWQSERKLREEDAGEKRGRGDWLWREEFYLTVIYARSNCQYREALCVITRVQNTRSLPWDATIYLSLLIIRSFQSSLLSAYFNFTFSFETVFSLKMWGNIWHLFYAFNHKY